MKQRAWFARLLPLLPIRRRLRAPQEQPTKAASLSRRAGLRAVGAAGAGLAVGAGGSVLGPASAALAQPGSTWRTERLEVDFTPVDAISIVRAGSGPPQRGDGFYVDAPIYPTGQVGGAQIGVYQCFGAWTRPGTEMSAPNQRLTTVQFQLSGRGTIMGLINEGGADPSAHVGAVQGGTGAFAGALGTFRQVSLTGGVTGASPGQQVVRAVFELLLPNVGGAGAPAQIPR